MPILEFGTKYIVFRHIEMVEWLDEPVEELDEETGETKTLYGFVVQLASGHRETLLYADDARRESNFNTLMDGLDSLDEPQSE